MSQKLIRGLLVLVGVGAFAGLYYAYSLGMLNITLRRPYIQEVSSELPSPSPSVAFVNVNLVPMDHDGLLEDQTVLIRDGIIEKIGSPEDLTLPADAHIIDGKGRYLMPGLVDMHVHIQEENELLLFVAYGVTTVRNMWGNTGLMLWLGNADQLALRAKIDAGELLGPTIYSAGPVIESPPSKHPMMRLVRSTADAERAIQEVAEAGFDFVKVYDHLSPELYERILATAREFGLPVVGHVPLEVGLDAVLEGEQASIEHLTGYLDMDAAELNIAEDRIEHYVEKTRESGVWVVPTIVLHQYAVYVEGLDTVEARPELKYVSPRMIRVWRFFTRTLQGSRTYAGSDYPAQMVALATMLTGRLHAGGARILVGTDTDNGYVIPGLSVHEELQHLVDSGLSPYEALRAATRDPAEAMGSLAEFGTLTEGKRADLLLLEANPLLDVSNAEERVGVMIRGRWLPEAQLRTMLEELAASYAPALLDRIWPLLLITLGVFLVIWRMRIRAKRTIERG